MECVLNGKIIKENLLNVFSEMVRKMVSVQYGMNRELRHQKGIIRMV